MGESRHFATRGLVISEQNVEVVRLMYEGFNESGVPDFR
jgi:hypothetical protein